MKLIADSGSTKTDWALVSDEGSVTFFHTQGINPVHQDDATIVRILSDEFLPQLQSCVVAEVFFYGSGVRSTEEDRMQSLLAATLGCDHAEPTTSLCHAAMADRSAASAGCAAVSVEAHSDLLGAARALFGHEQGLACILGTGSNSCLYDGSTIVRNTPPLGYILGDEGSGAALGITLLGALYKGLLPDCLRRQFEATMGMTLNSVIDRVYRQPLANRFLASLSPFVRHHLDDECLRQLVVDHFRRFFQRNLAPYDCRHLPVRAVGSMAYYYEEQLRQAATAEGYGLSTVVRSPIELLVAYHCG